MNEYYLLWINEIEDFKSGRRFLHEVDSKLEGLYSKRNHDLHSDFYFECDRKNVLKMDMQIIANRLKEISMPEFLLFEKDNNLYYRKGHNYYAPVKEAISGVTFYIEKRELESSVITEKVKNHYLEELTDEEKMGIITSIKEFKEKDNNKDKVLVLSK